LVPFADAVERRRIIRWGQGTKQNCASFIFSLR